MRFCFGIVLLLLTATTILAAPQSWELQNGQWQPVQSATTEPVASDPTLDRVEQLLDARQPASALKLVIPWLKTNRDHPLRDRALYLLAECYFRTDDWLTAYYHLDELMDYYPESSYFYKALEKQYVIADGCLNGHRRKFLGLPILTDEDEAVEMLYRIQQRSPGSPLAEKALLRTADYYYADSQFDLAADAYSAYVKSYPRSPEIPRVRLREAFAAYAQFRGPKFDPTPLIDARTQLVDVVALYPELAAQENVPSFIDRIDRTFARKIFLTADFYRRTHEPVAAVYTYRLVINTYPDSPEAGDAAKALKKMPAYALDRPQPPALSSYIPASQPSTPTRQGGQ